MSSLRCSWHPFFFETGFRFFLLFLHQKEALGARPAVFACWLILVVSSAECEAAGVEMAAVHRFGAGRAGRTAFLYVFALALGMVEQVLLVVVQGHHQRRDAVCETIQNSVAHGSRGRGHGFDQHHGAFTIKRHAQSLARGQSR
jgi:hypothetical protein